MSNLSIEELVRLKKKIDDSKERLIFHCQADLDEAERQIPDLRTICHCHVDKAVEPGQVIRLASMEDLRTNLQWVKR